MTEIRHSNDVKFRPAQERDFERIGDKLTNFTRKSGGPDDYSQLSTYFMALSKGGEIVGEAILSQVQEWGSANLDLLHVDESQRGKGVGKNLLSTVEEFAKRNGSLFIRLTTPEFQGVGFYEKCGYTEQGERMPTRVSIDGKPQFEATYTKKL